MGERRGAVEAVAMRRPEKEFWNGKRVFLTGHTGFKGVWLALWLEMLGAEVYGYSLPAEEPSLYADAALSGRFPETLGDIRDRESVSRAMEECGPSVVFHLAAQPLVRKSFAMPAYTFETNVMGTVNVLDAARNTPAVRSIVVITTDKCYKNMEWDWGYRENDILGGKDPYSASKACAELACEAWRSSFLEDGGALLATTRAGNVIGGGDWAEDRLVPDAMRAFFKGEPLLVRYPDAVRPWQHVLEPLAGYLELARLLYEGNAEFAAAWNFGPTPGDSLTVGEMADLLGSLLGKDFTWRAHGGEHARESHLLRLDSAKAVRRLGWKPLLDAREAVRWTVEWYREKKEGRRALDLSLAQIENYTRIMGMATV